MPEHIRRKDLKRDEFAETVMHGAEAVASHKRFTVLIAVAVVVVLAAVFGWRFYTQRQTTKAQVAFDAAMKVYEARIRKAGEPELPGEVAYVDEKNKFTDAATKFVEVARDYPRTRPGQMARYWAALSYGQIENYDEALKLLRELESGPADLQPLAKFQIARIYSKQGKNDEAVKLYKELIDTPSLFVPKPVAMMALAGHYAASNPAEARKILDQVKLEYPDSAVAREADQRLQLLPGA